MSPGQLAILRARSVSGGKFRNALAATTEALGLGQGVMNFATDMASSGPTLDTVNTMAGVAGMLPGLPGAVGRAVEAGTGAASLAQHWKEASTLSKISMVTGLMSFIPGVGEVAFPISLATGLADTYLKSREQQKDVTEEAATAAQEHQPQQDRKVRQARKPHAEHAKKLPANEAHAIAANEKLAAGDLGGLQKLQQEAVWMHERERLLHAGAPEWQAQEGAGALVAARGKLNDLRTAASYARLVDARSGGADVARAAALSREQRTGTSGGSITHESLSALLNTHMAPLGHMSREQFSPRLKLGGA